MPGQSLVSPHGAYRLGTQTDGNLVLNEPNSMPGSTGCPFAVWALGTWGQSGNYLVMQADGNLVVDSRAGTAVWATQSWGTGNVLNV